MALRLSSATLLLLVILLKGCCGSQTWNKEPSNKEVNPEENVILACRIYSKQGTCSWQKDGKPQGMFMGKYEWAGDRSAGDCSIRILDAGEVDDGDWECQVTASAFASQDALTSRIARVVVRVPPNPPVLEVESQLILAGNNFTVKESQPASIKCLSRYGNPPATIKWFIGKEEIPDSSYDQTNVTEVDNPKTWMAYSVLSHTFRKPNQGATLRCTALHQAYRTKGLDVQVILDVQYSPTVTLEGAPSDDIEEGMDDLTLHCLTDANPTANVMWRVKGSNDVFSFQPKLTFSPVERRNTATYTCEARNAVGGSDPISVDVDVKYPPKVLQVSPFPTITAALHNNTLLQCVAEGNPQPKYTWTQTVGNNQERVVRGHDSTLLLEHIGYQHQGIYECLAESTIKGQPRESVSQQVSVEVQGAPQVLQYTVERKVDVEKGQDALIQIVFCSDPQPLKTSWEWGSIQLEAGNTRGRYLAENLVKASPSDDCYAAKLQVQKVTDGDAREYTFNVENIKGADQYAVGLHVTEPATMATVIGSVIACLIILIIITLIVLYAFKREKLCFSHRKNKDGLVRCGGRVMEYVGGMVKWCGGVLEYVGSMAKCGGGGGIWGMGAGNCKVEPLSQHQQNQGSDVLLTLDKTI